MKMLRIPLLMVGLLLCAQGFAATAQQDKMTTCNADATTKALKGDERKAFMSNYLEGIRIKAERMKKTIHVTDIQPGYIQTEMLLGNKLFWIASLDKASLQIFTAIEQKKQRVPTRRPRPCGSKRYSSRPLRSPEVWPEGVRGARCAVHGM